MTGSEDDTVLRALIESADRDGAATFLRIDGLSITYEQANEAVSAVGAALVELGVVAGDRVAIMSDNRREAVWAWLGSNAASAIDVPFNTAAQGAFLSGQMASAQPRVAMGTADYLARMAGTGCDSLELVVSIGEPVDPGLFAGTIRHTTFEDLQALGRSLDRGMPSMPTASTIATIMYTSGTTGPSKGVLIPQRYYSVWGRRASSYLDVRPGEVIYCVQPLFHVDARAYIQNALFSNATSAIGTRFSVTNFWEEIRQHEANVFSYIGTMLWLLFKQPESEWDRQHAVRIAGGAATPAEIHRAFEERFGLQLREAYGMTESLFLAHAHESTPIGSVGTLVPELEGALVDDELAPVALGDAGELVVKPVTSFCTSPGYWNRDDDDRKDGWFHTGDLLRQDVDGNLYFVGRKKDSIRRRGENVSAWEVEESAMRHPDVLEVAVIGVPSPLGEEDVALLAKLVDDAAPSPADLRLFLSQDLPKFALPRFIEFVDAFPKTPSERVDKAKVREAGLSADAWDAEAAGSA